MRSTGRMRTDEGGIEGRSAEGGSPSRETTEAAVSAARRPSSHVRLAPYVRLSFDQARGQHVLLAPESVSVLNATGAAILGLCDGRRTVAEIVAQLRGRYDRVAEDEVQRFIARLAIKRWVELSDG